MAVSQFLALRNNGGSPQVGLYNNSTVTNQGNTFGSLDNNSSISTTTCITNQAVIALRGFQTFLALTGGVIYLSTDGGISFTSQKTLTSLYTTGQGAHSGFRISTSGGSETIFVMYGNGGTSLLTDYSTDGGTTWTTVSGTSGIGDNFGAGLQDAVMWQGDGYFSLWNNTRVDAEVWIFNASTKTMSVTTGLVNFGNAKIRFANFNGNLCCLGTDSSGNLSIFQLSGTTWSKVLNNFANYAVPNPQSQNELFVQGGFLWALVHNATVWHCWKITTAFIATSSDTSIPAAFNSSTGRTQVFPDYAATTGSEPQLYVYYSSDASSATNFSSWQWNGTSVMTHVGATGGSAIDYLGASKNSQGCQFWQGSDRVEIVSRVGVSGGVRYTFKLYSASGTDTVSVRGWYGANTASYEYLAATLANPSVGTLVGNSVTGLTADNTTSYQVTWNASTDGIAAGTTYDGFMMEQF